MNDCDEKASSMSTVFYNHQRGTYVCFFEDKISKETFTVWERICIDEATVDAASLQTLQ